MKNLSVKYSILLAIISGVITALIFPTMFGGILLPNLGFLAWFSLIPLFVAIYNAGTRRTFILTFITGFISYSISLYWIYNAMTRYGKLSPIAAMAVLFLMVVILGAYLGIITSWVRWFRSKWGGPALILLPVAWVAVELARNCFPVGGFSWNNLAYSQSSYLAFIQTADIASIYGITFLIVMVNQLFAELIMGWSEVRRLHLCFKAVSVGVLFCLVLAYGWYRLDTVSARSPATQTVRIALVQGNIPQDEKWEIEFLEKNLAVYRDYTKWIKDSDATLAIWPESAYPYLIPVTEMNLSPERLGLNPERKDAPWLLFGALSLEGIDPNERLYNSTILVNNRGMIVDRYHKVHLVPYGEYVPFKKILFFLDKLVAPVGDFKAGDELTPLLVKGDFFVGPLICYEDVFPEISRTLVLNGANILVNLTNDAWYGWTSAAHQHLAISIFRSVENRRYMLRATNTGVSAVVDPRGKVELKSGLFQRSFMVTGVPILEDLTIYDKIGDIFAYICALIVLILTIIVAIRAIWSLRGAKRRGNPV